MSDISDSTVRVLIMELQASNALTILNGKFATGMISVAQYNAGLDYIAKAKGNIIISDLIKCIEKVNPTAMNM